MYESLASALPDSPLCSPAWRWLYAQYQSEQPRRSRRRIHDPWVERAWRHLLAIQNRQDRSRRRWDSKFDPLIQETCSILSNDFPELRWHLESLLLTGIQLDEVASHTDVNREVVECFAQLYFDVGSRLNATDWIMARAVCCGPCNNFGGPQPEGIWRYAAYTGGLPTLQVVMAVTGHRPWPDWLAKRARTDPSFDLAKFRLKAQLTIKMMLARSQREVDTLLAIHEQSNRIERKPRRPKKQQDTMLVVMQDFLRMVDRGSKRGKKLKIRLDRPKPAKTRRWPQGLPVRTLW